MRAQPDLYSLIRRGTNPRQETTGPLHQHHVRMVDASFYVAGNGNESPLGIHDLQQRDGRQLSGPAAAVRAQRPVPGAVLRQVDLEFTEY